MNHVARAGILMASAALGAGTAAIAVDAQGGSSSSAASTSAAGATHSRAGSPAATRTGAKSVSAIYRAAVQGVVEVKVQSAATGYGPFGPQQQTQLAQGTGFELDANGDIVTNAHVVSGASSITVTTHDGSAYKATLVGSDPTTDVAVIHIQAASASLHPLQLGSSAGLQVGDGVVAIGDPFGLADTVTAGIVSALDRTISSPNNHPIQGAIQTDAAINHGNSGGPLLDDQGRVVGITSQIYSGSGTSGNVGIGFAVPSNTVSTIAAQLIATGKASHPFLGVSLTDISSAQAQATGLTTGVEVARVSAGSPADRAGLRGATGQRSTPTGPVPTGGDVITALDGARTTSAQQVVAAVSRLKPGDRVTLTVVRAGATRTVSITLGSQ